MYNTFLTLSIGITYTFNIDSKLNANNQKIIRIIHNNIYYDLLLMLVLLMMVLLMLVLLMLVLFMLVLLMLVLLMLVLLMLVLLMLVLLMVKVTRFIYLSRIS